MFNSTERVLQYLVRPLSWKQLVGQSSCTSCIQLFSFFLSSTAYTLVPEYLLQPKLQTDLSQVSPVPCHFPGTTVPNEPSAVSSFPGTQPHEGISRLPTSLFRPKKNQNSTSVIVICSYQHDSEHPGLHTQEIYSEMSHLTHGVTQLGNYTLDKDSLYVNGEHGLCFPRGCLQPFFYFPSLFKVKDIFLDQ